MRRMVIVGLVGGAGAVTVVALARRRAMHRAADGSAATAAAPDWAPLRLVTDPLAPTTRPTTGPNVLAGAVLADAVVADAVVAETAWVDAAADGSCPISHPVKGKLSSGIFHEPGGRFYGVTKAQRCYVDAASAVADGLRPSQR